MAEEEPLETLATLAVAAAESPGSNSARITRHEGESDKEFKRRRNRIYNMRFKKKKKIERERTLKNHGNYRVALNYVAKKTNNVTFISELCEELLESGDYKTLAARVRKKDVLRVNTVTIWQDPKFKDCMEKSLTPNRKQNVPPEFELGRRFQVVARDTATNTWHELYEVKTSTIEGAGNGLFALRPFKRGEWMGIYIGEVRPFLQVKKTKTIYAMRFRDKDKRDKIMDPGIPGPGRSTQRLPVYFGIQFCNDPDWKEEGETTKKKTKTKNTNVSVYSDLGVLATRRIDVGDEIFLDYNMHDVDDSF